MQSTRLKYSFAPFYHEAAQYPELPKFRTLGAQWTKKLFDDTEEVLKKEQAVNDALAKKYGKAAMTVLDCPRSLIRDDPDLYEKWKEYEDSLQTYSKGLCLAHEVYKLPSHSLFFGKRLGKYFRLFENEIFGPTGEQATAYQDPSCSGFCALVGIPGWDSLTNAYVNNSDWIEKNILGRVRRLWTRQRPVSQRNQPATISLATITSIIDFVACIFVPLLLMTVMFALVSIRPLKARIALVGVFGLVFALSAKVFTGRIRRGEIFAYTAAFFAISSVFVDTTSGGVVGGL